MSDNVLNLEARLRAVELEYQRVRARFVGGAVIAVVALGVWGSQPAAQQSNDPLRVRGLVIEDANGRPRIVMGTALSDGRVGLQINDANGAERLGMSLQANGNMVLGLDAPPGHGG
jgi:hypothetical protein